MIYYIKTSKTQDYLSILSKENRKFLIKKDIANKFNAFFTNIGKNLADKIIDVPHKHFSDYLESKPNSIFEFQPVETKKVNKIISQLDS